MNTAFADAISTSFPGTSSVTANGPVALVLNIYYFALALAGFLALGVLVYAGLMRIFQAGSHSGQGEAKKWFAAAGTGLILLLGAYFLLSLVNPSLTVLQFPGLARLAPANLNLLPSTGALTGYGCTTDSGLFSTVPHCSTKDDCSDVPECNTGIHSLCSKIASCQALADACTIPTSGFCSVAQLQANGGACFGAGIDQAAQICNAESGGNPMIPSGSDICKDGSSVSIGLFQINLTFHSLAGVDCPKAFHGTYTGPGSDCYVTDRALYNRCVALAKTVNYNIAEACSTSNGGRSWRQWGTAKQCGL